MKLPVKYYEYCVDACDLPNAKIDLLQTTVDSVITHTPSVNLAQYGLLQSMGYQSKVIKNMTYGGTKKSMG